MSNRVTASSPWSLPKAQFFFCFLGSALFWLSEGRAADRREVAFDAEQEFQELYAAVSSSTTIDTKAFDSQIKALQHGLVTLGYRTPLQAVEAWRAENRRGQINQGLGSAL
jgi:hypothetical protein